MSDLKPPRFHPYPSVTRASWKNDLPENDWELGIMGELSDKQTEMIEHLINVPRRSRGTIYFDSCGGNVYAGLALATLIRLRGLQIAGVVTGECSSAALLPFAACRERYVTPHCTLLFHPMRWQSEEDVRMEEAAEWARHFRVLEEDLDNLLARLFECPLELISEWTRPGKFIQGSDMVKNGLAKMIDLFSGDLWEQLGKFSTNSNH